MPYDFSHLWNIRKIKSNPVNNKIKINSQVLATKWWSPEGKEGGKKAWWQVITEYLVVRCGVKYADVEIRNYTPEIYKVL